MRQQEHGPKSPPDAPLVSPWAALGAGLGLVALGWLWGLAADATAPVLRALTLAVGLTVTGSGLALYLSRAGRDLEGRLTSAGTWLLSAGAVYLARVGLGSHFDSMNALLTFFTIAAILGAAITALPSGWRKLAAGVLIALHFAAILTAVTIVPPPNGPPPYLSNHLWSRLSRPWLQFTVLNNGYHFYAPEPGPAQLLWFHVEFADGETAWVRIPDHDKVGSQVERRRLGALASHVTNMTQPPSSDFEQLRQRREEAGRKHVPPIPMAASPPEEQYHEMSQHGLILLGSFVRRVARTTEHPAGGAAEVTGVKVYRVDYYNPPAEHFQAGRPPLDPTLYAPYYVGEYDAAGRLKKSSLELKRPKPDAAVSERVQDPFLFWQLPIVAEAADEKAAAEVGPPRQQGDPGLWRREGRIKNYVRVHAGDKKDQESIP